MKDRRGKVVLLLAWGILQFRQNMTKAKKNYLEFADEITSDGSEKNFDDEHILEASREDPRLFGLLVDRYEPSFLRVAQRVVKSPEEAEDVVQEAFVKIYRFARHFDPRQARFKSWAYKIVMNVAITHYNKRKRDAMLIPEEYDPTVAESQRMHTAYVHDRGLESVISSAIEELPEDLRALLVSYYLEDKSYKTIATKEGLSIGALKMKLFRARKGMKKVLEEQKEV